MKSSEITVLCIIGGGFGLLLVALVWGFSRTTLSMGRRAAGHDWIAELLLCLPILAITLIVKFAIPLGHKQLHFPLVVLMGTALAAFSLGRLRLEASNLRAFLAMIAVLLITQIFDLPVGTGHFSVKSLGLIAILLSLYAFEMEAGTTRPDIAIRFFRNVIVFIAICGILQFSIQFATHSTKYIFPIEENMPRTWIAADYANELPLYYGSRLWKSNGIFLLEPSFFSQYCALGILIELLTFRKLWRLAILGGGVVVAFSGTGIAMLMLAAGIYIFEKRQFALVLAIAVCLVGLYVIVDNANILHETHLDVFVKRLNELSNKSSGSSGHARFIAPFLMLDHYNWPHFNTALFGLSAGSARDAMRRMDSWDPTWAKITLEYGVVGMIAFTAFVVSRTFRAIGSIYLKAVLLLQFFVLSAALPAQTHVWILVFLIWPRANNEAAALERERAATPAVAPALHPA